HYFKHHMFWDDDNYLLNHVSVLKDIPIHIVHGRYDVDCRVSGAYELQQQLPHASLEIIEEAGHSPFEDNMMSALLNIMDTLAK
ncbi:MAG TPA: prolyl aminopeptidase, partial [Facklamia tabacinasalis]|nr:prolyl aminopeptidase [Ruoffia tabacinasalis]